MKFRRMLSILLAVLFVVGLMPLGLVSFAAKEQFERTTPPYPTVDREFLIYVEDIYTITGRGTVVTGRVVYGTVKLNDKVILKTYDDKTKEPVEYELTIKGIEMFHKTFDEAQAGDNVGLLIEGVDKALIHSGDAIVGKGTHYLTNNGEYIGAVTLNEGKTIKEDETIQAYWPGSDVTVTFFTVSDSLSGESRTGNVTIYKAAHPVTWYPGQDITLRRAGVEYGKMKLMCVVPDLLESHYKDAYFFGFDTKEEVNEWTFVDRDEDGNNFILNSEFDPGASDSFVPPHEGAGALVSASFIPNGSKVLEPDNWAISPAVEIDKHGAFMSFFTTTLGDYGDETFEVYAGTSPDPEKMSMIIANNPANIKTAIRGEANYGWNIGDLSAFAGETIYIAFRHFGTKDVYLFGLDSIRIYQYPFDDVEYDDWFADAALWAYEGDYMRYTGGRNFSPNMQMTRAQIVLILAKLALDGEELPEYKGAFKDVKASDWFARGVQWAADTGVTSGTGDGTTFSPNAPLTREQLSTFFKAFADKILKGKYTLTEDLSSYNDKNKTSSWALEGMKFAVQFKLISGYGNSVTLAPKAVATRNQTAVILKNFWTVCRPEIAPSS